jgi:hypothetical protein
MSRSLDTFNPWTILRLLIIPNSEIYYAIKEAMNGYQT